MLSRDNPTMDLPPETREKIESLLQDLAELDPADLPEPAAELAALLGSILEGADTS